MTSRKREARKNKKRRKTAAARADRHVLYENSVQDVESEIDFVDAEFKRLAGRRGRYLREDFCGTANTSCEWVRRRRDNQATGVDLDPDVLAWGRDHHVAGLKPAQRDRIMLIEDDVTRVATPRQDMVLAMNFSYWIFTERRAMLDYFRSVRAALVEDGVFFLDCYGGYDSLRVHKERTRYRGYTYVWDTAKYNPLDASVTCHIHFNFKDGSRLKKAFTYVWRMWTMPEIREILAEAGFTDVTIYAQGWDEDEQDGDGDFEPVEVIDADAGWICFIAARVA